MSQVIKIIGWPPPKQLMRMECGTTAFYTYEGLTPVEAMKVMSAKCVHAKAKITQKNYILVNPKTGTSEYILRVEILKSGEPLKKRGRKQKESNKNDN